MSYLILFTSNGREHHGTSMGRSLLVLAGVVEDAHHPPGAELLGDRTAVKVVRLSQVVRGMVVGVVDNTAESAHKPPQPSCWVTGQPLDSFPAQPRCHHRDRVLP